MSTIVEGRTPRSRPIRPRWRMWLFLSLAYVLVAAVALAWISYLTAPSPYPDEFDVAIQELSLLSIVAAVPVLLLIRSSFHTARHSCQSQTERRAVYMLLLALIGGSVAGLAVASQRVHVQQEQVTDRASAISFDRAGIVEIEYRQHLVAQSATLATSAPPHAIVAVSVATLWSGPNMARPIDRPSTSNPVDLRRWLSRLSTSDGYWFIGRLQTQVLYGTEVAVLARSGTWSKVAVLDQPSQLNSLGYPGWLPTRQLTTNLSLRQVARTHPVAIVTQRTARLRDAVTGARVMEVSYGTRLSIVGSTAASYLVARPAGGKLAIARSAVTQYASIGAIPRPTGAQITAAARSFLGLPYLWAGTSGFGLDCSGLIYTVYHRFGITIPRDADQQALRGRKVSLPGLRPGDLLFFAGPGGAGAIHHVALYVGAGTMIEAPGIGQPVKLTPLYPLSNEYAGARRFL